MQNFLESAQKQFAYYRILGDKTFTQLEDEDLFKPLDSNNNSIAVIVNHLSGNMLSRWTDFLTSDGEKEWRERDKEFENIINTEQDLILAWNKGWDCLEHALKQIDESNADTTIYIRNQGHSITEAVNRQLCHYAYHVGQIVLIGKHFKGDQWQSLSIAKGNSVAYNTNKFKQEKRDTHFTDEYLDPS